MRSLFVLFVVAFFSLSSLQAQEAVYTVYLGTFLDAQKSNFEPLESLGFLYADEMSNNLSKVFIGGYTSKAAGDAVAVAARKKGYMDATVVELKTQDSPKAAVVQLGIKNARKKIDWSEFSKAGKIYFILRNDQVKVVTGIFPSMASAQSAVGELRKRGYKDAFAKSVPEVLLHELNGFVLGKPAATQEGMFGEEPVAAKTSVPADVPVSYDFEAGGPVVIKSPTAPEAEHYTPPAQSDLLYRPEIRTKVKRGSALQLQKILKRLGYYSSSLDGYYGRGTAGAYDKALKELPALKKYSVLANHLDELNAAEKEDGLQYYINTLPDDPAHALSGLSASSEPLAKAYRAYWSFVTRGPSREVNDLMNAAVHQAYADPKTPVPSRFDPAATYAYANLSQLILHLSYIHRAVGKSIAAPCWLFQRHPKEALSAFEPEGSMTQADYRIQACAGFDQWPEVRLLIAIGEDLNAMSPPAPDVLANARSRQTRYLLSPKPLPASQTADLQARQKRLISNLDVWAGKDPLHQKIVTAFKISYYQTQVLLEDFYMDKDLNPDQARGLALGTLDAIVEPYVIRFLK